MRKKSEVSNLEILQAISDFSASVDKRFDSVESRLENLEYKQEDVLSKISNVVYRFELRDLEKRVSALENK